jgi:putative membrane protein
MQRADLVRLSRVDALYGVAAVAVIVAGVSRLIWGANDAEFYTENVVFWLKMASFAAVGLLSIVPTVRYIRWRNALREDPSWTPPAGEVRTAQRFPVAQLLVFPAIPICAALMARGIGN